MEEEEPGGGGGGGQEAEDQETEQEESSSSRLTATVDAINSLISSSFSTSLFPLKWELIRGSLHRLHAGLAAADEAADGAALAELLRGVLATACGARPLVGRSEGRHYGGGKLLLRSDLDVLAGELDAHVRRLEGFCASGALAQGRALVVPKPAAGASRDDMRFYVRDLFARLRVGGSPEMRKQAAVALNEVLCEDERYVKVVAADVDDGVGVLVGLLECPDAGVQEEALQAVSAIAGFDAYRGELVVGGAIAPVVRALDTGTATAKERAARALRRLTENSDNAWAVAAHGGVTALLGACGDGSSSADLVSTACRVLRSLAGVEEIKKYMVEAGAAAVFVSLLRSAADEATQIQAMEFLAAIAAGDPATTHAVLQEGAVESLVHVLDPISPRSSKATEVAFRAIETLCFASPSSTQDLIGAGFLGRVLFFLRSGDSAVQHSALKAACRLCATSEETKKAMGDAGFMPELVGILRTKSAEAREMAAEALCAMVSVHRNRRRFVQEDHNVGQVLELLSPDDEKPAAAAATKRFLLSALMHVTDSSSGRRKIASSEHRQNLERLAETNVAEAKKIVRKLAGNRLRSILNGIWSM